MELVTGASTGWYVGLVLGVVVIALIIVTAIFWMLGRRSFLKRAVG